MQSCPCTSPSQPLYERFTSTWVNSSSSKIHCLSICRSASVPLPSRLPHFSLPFPPASLGGKGGFSSIRIEP